MPGGAAVLHGRFPSAHDHNQLVLHTPVAAVDVVRAADDVLGGAGLSHRQLWVLDAGLADALEDGLCRAGYAREDEQLLWQAPGGPPLQPTVERLEVEERVAVAVDGWVQEQPGWPREVADQLGRRIVTALDAVDATFLAVRDAGRVVAHADLFVRDGVAQVEEVMTEPAVRNGGRASALVREAVRLAGGAGAETVVVLADAHDWPVTLYRRLGFADLGRTASFAR